MENYDLDNFEPAAKIVVIGVGGAGNNAVNRMIDEEIQNVEFFVANTDKQALSTSKARNRIILGEDIAKIAKDAGALVVGIVTRPFIFEGKKRVVNSISGLNKLRANVDSIIVVSNDKLLMTNGNAPISQAFSHSDKVLADSVKTVVNLILLPAVINLDFADVRNTLKDSGVAMIGFGEGEGQNRAKDAANAALSCPLLETSITGARRAIVAVTCGPNVSLYDAQDTVNLLIDASGHDIDVKFGVSINNQLDDQIIVSVIASDFEEEIDFSQPSMLSAPTRDAADSIIMKPVEPVTPPKEPEQPQEEGFDDSDILPGFLRKQ